MYGTDLYDGRDSLDWSGIEGSEIEADLATIYAAWYKAGFHVYFDVMNSNDMDGVWAIVVDLRPGQKGLHRVLPTYTPEDFEEERSAYLPEEGDE